MAPNPGLAPGKSCLVAIDAPCGPVLQAVFLPAEAAITVALAQARRLLEATAAAPAGIDWEGAVGIWGRRCDRSEIPTDGDRVELYRPLAMDPRQRRRARARTARPQVAEGGAGAAGASGVVGAPGVAGAAESGGAGLTSLSMRSTRSLRK